MPYHVLVVPREGPTDVAYSLDLTEDEVIERLKAPYEAGSPLVVSGRTFRPEEIKEVQVSYTVDPSAVVLCDVHRVLESSSSIVGQLMPAARWMITDKRFSQNVTDRFITQPAPLFVAGPESTGPHTGHAANSWPLVVGAMLSVLVGIASRWLELLALWQSTLVALVVFMMIVAVWGVVRRRHRTG